MNKREENEYFFSGTLPEGSRTYVKREADDRLYQNLKLGKFCYVFNARQTGKSSLRLQVMRRLRNDGIACVAIDLSELGTQYVDFEQWYFDLTDIITEKLDLDVDLCDWWLERQSLSPQRRFSKFIEGVVFANIAENIVIFIDEIDSVLSLNFPTDDFFAFIRNRSNERADSSEYDRLTFCLLGVATPSDLIKDKKRTPFNIGQKIELTGLEFEKASLSLKAGLAEKVDNPEAVLKEVLNWTGGQPFLTQKLCKIVAEKIEGKTANVEELVQKYMVENWESQDEPEHFKTIRDRLLRDEKRASKLLGIYREILQRGEIPGDDSYEQVELRLSGLVVNREGKLKVYNPIYKRVFNDNWVKVQLDNLRPEFYREAIAAWLDSGCRDESRLLRGEGLEEALEWSKDRSLSVNDYNFFNASQQAEIKVLKSARQEAREGTKIERLGVNALRLFEQGQEIEGLLLAMEAGQALWEYVKNGRPLQEYPATSPLLALQVIVTNIRERNQFPSSDGTIASLCFSPDGEYIITGAEEGIAILYNLYGKQLADFMYYCPSWGNNVSFSPDGKYIAVASVDCTTKLWDLSGNLVREFRHEHPVGNVSFSPNGQLLATTSGGVVRLWDFSGNQITEFLAHEKDEVNSLSFSPDGRYIATGSHDLTAKLWDLSGNQLAEFTEHQLGVTSVCFSPDGQYIATASDARIRVWNLSNHEIREFDTGGDLVYSISFTPDGKYLAASLEDFTIRLWNFLNQQRAKLLGNVGGRENISFSPDGRYLAAGSPKGTTWWDLSGNHLAKFTIANRLLTAIEFSHDSQYIATASLKITTAREVQLWDLSGNQIAEFNGSSPCFSLDGNYIAASDGKTKLWDLAGNQIAEFTGKAVAFSSDSKYIATTLSKQDLIRLWDLSGNCISEFNGCSLCFSPDSNYVATIDGSSRLWDLSGNQIAEFLGEFATFSPDGQYVATVCYSSGYKNAVMIWDLSGSPIALLAGHHNSINRVAFSPDGNYIATASDDCTVRLWGLSGNEIAKCVGHHQGVSSVNFSASSEYIITTSTDRTVRLWNLLGNQIGELKTDGASAAVSPDGKLIATSDDRSVKIWRVETLEELLARGCEWLKYYFGNHPEAREKLKICHNLNK